jgi:hypothetical protein
MRHENRPHASPMLPLLDEKIVIFYHIIVIVSKYGSLKVSEFLGEVLFFDEVWVRSGFFYCFSVCFGF